MAYIYMETYNFKLIQGWKENGYLIYKYKTTPNLKIK